MSSNATPTKTTAADGEKKSLFTERDEDLLKIAMIHCLKSGPPDIDMQKFFKYGGFNTVKTAQNTWGKLKTKLNTLAAETKKDDGELEEGEIKEDEPATPATGKGKAKATPKSTKTTTPASKKRGKKADADDEETSPKKKGKKVKAEEEVEEDEVKDEDGA